jgi:hypothetical protein
VTHSKQSYRKREYDPDKLQLGDHLYYDAITKGNSGKTKALVNTTRAALQPYFSFINEAIKAEKKRGQYEVNWKRVESKFVIRIKPIQQKFRIATPGPKLNLHVGESELKESDNKLIYEDQEELFSFNLSDGSYLNGSFIFSPEIFPENSEQVLLNYQPVEYSVQSLVINQQSEFIDDSGRKLKVTSVEETESGWNLTVASDRHLRELYLNGQQLEFDRYNNAEVEKLYDGDREIIYDKMGIDFNLLSLPQSKILRSDTGDEYSWYSVKSQKEEFKIQLIDDDCLETEKPISEHFFDDEVEAIYQGRNQRNSYEIKRGASKAEEKILVLKKPFRGEIELKENEPIKIAVNTTNLQRQKEAIRYLNDSPVGNHKQLIKLFERKTDYLWKAPGIRSINEWYVLTDTSYDGTVAQRKFVEKAVSTEDFAILEGPPGSGKTTAILELILQLARQGKRILLSASTHVAIDNVLERIKVRDRDDLIEPLRIGDSGRIDESVTHFQIDNKISELEKSGMQRDLAERLVLDSANLVCGTTMGIQRHPEIVNRNRKSPLPFTPKYDYMIIDESSKTTFQEFLVPALHAKKWILVGDIKQLSPYIEQSHIVHNFNHLVDKEKQLAIRTVFEALENNRNPYAIELPKKSLSYVDDFLDHWKSQEQNPFEIKVVTYLRKETELDETLMLNLLGSDLILIEQGCWTMFRKIIPKTHIVVLQNRLEDEFGYQQSYLNRKKKLPQYSPINNERSKTNNPLEISDHYKSFLKEKNWPEEITWRMIRVYERRMLKNPDSYYEKSFRLLKPVEEDNAVDRVYNMTLPSILESIQVGNGEFHKNHTTITEGFSKKELASRHEVLDYQHRMHPEISQFSREQFYSSGDKTALLDSRHTGREWEYDRYPSRSIWIDLPKKADRRGDRIHQAEVTRTIEELKHFIEFAKSTPHPSETEWSVAVITFYRPQESHLRKALQEYCNQPHKMSRFSKDGVQILNYTVDKFQGMEADIVFLNMVRGNSIGFLDNINRLNVALTRARFQRVILGDNHFYKKKQKQSDELCELAESCEVVA